jgi:hypothetical protein
MPAGRPAIYTQELADKVCERLACGESMRSVSRDPDMPAMSTLFKWIREIEEFSQQYAKAKEESADALVEDMLDIADNQVANPVIIDGVPLEIDGEIVKAADGPAVAHARLRVDTRKWAASKLKPKKYGETSTLNLDDVRTGEVSRESLVARMDAVTAELKRRDKR